MGNAKTVTISQLFDPHKLAEHIAQGNITESWHPGKRLRVLNYAPQAMFAGAWDDVTTICRGLIVDGDKVVSRPFKKFFNLNTIQFPETLEKNLPGDIPEITHKLDGSLGILYSDNGVPAVATRGSFTSPQALWATDRYRSKHVKATWPDGYTPMFEIIYHANRVVVEYAWEDLILLGLVNVETGAEMPHGEVAEWAKFNEIRHVRTVPYSIEEMLKITEGKNAEGFVVTWHLGDCPPLKIKYKFSEYVRLHKIITEVTPKGIWELLSEGADLDPLRSYTLPLAFAKWVNSWERKLKDEYDARFRQASYIYNNCPFIVDEPDREARKLIALQFKGQAERLKCTALLPVVFALLDDKDPAPAIWKLVKGYTQNVPRFGAVDG